MHTNPQRQPDTVDKQAQVPDPLLQEHSRSPTASRNQIGNIFWVVTKIPPIVQYNCNKRTTNTHIETYMHTCVAYI